MYLRKYLSPIAALYLASDGVAITGLWLEGQKYFPKDLPGIDAPLPVFEQAEQWLNRYFSSSLPLPSLPPLAPQGSAFRQAVWKLLLDIPYGSTTTYGALTEKLQQQGIPAAEGG